MAKTDYIPLMTAACYLLEGKQSYLEWLKSAPTKSAGAAGRLYIYRDAPKQEYVLKGGDGQILSEGYVLKDGEEAILANGTLEKIQHYKNEQRDKLRSKLIKIIEYAANNDGPLLKGKPSVGNVDTSLPKDFLLDVRNGLTLTQDINSHHSKLLVFNGKDFLKVPATKALFQEFYYRDVVVDWIQLSKSSGALKVKRKTKYNWSEIKPIFLKVHSFHGGFSADDPNYKGPSDGARQVIKELKARNYTEEQIPDIKHIARKIREWGYKT